MKTKEIGLFMKSFDTGDRIYLDHMLRISNSIRNIVDQAKATKEEVCHRFKITPKKYDDFLCGNYDYSLVHTAILNAWWVEVETDKLKDRVPVQVPKSTKP